MLCLPAQTELYNVAFATRIFPLMLALSVKRLYNPDLDKSNKIVTPRPTDN